MKTKLLGVAALLCACQPAHETTFYVADPELLTPVQVALDAWSPVTAYSYVTEYDPDVYPNRIPDRNGVSIVSAADGYTWPASGETICVPHDGATRVGMAFTLGCSVSILICEELLASPVALQRYVAHEIGHYFGGKHEDGGVMQDGVEREAMSDVDPRPSRWNLELVKQRGDQPCE